MQIRIKRKVIIYNIDLYWCPQILHVMKRLPSVDQYWSVPTPAMFQHKKRLPNISISIIDTPPWNHLTFAMGFPTPVRQHLYIEATREVTIVDKWQMSCYKSLDLVKGSYSNDPILGSVSLFIMIFIVNMNKYKTFLWLYYIHDVKRTWTYSLWI